jgi:hypothetical protein
MPKKKQIVMPHSPSTEQIPFCLMTTAADIMRSADFARGVSDKRNGRPPAYDSYNHYQDDSDHVAKAKLNGLWSYERGRQWACIAPPSMPLRIDGRLNPKAVALCDSAFERKHLV